jgi:hypothetical protein
MWSQRNGRLSTITKVKVLSLEMFIALGQGFIKSETSIAACVNGKCVSNVPGSKSMVGNRIVCTGTWDSHVAPIKASNEQKMRRRKYGDMAVGLTHSRGVAGVMPSESQRAGTLEGVSSRTQRDAEAYAIH